MVLPGQLHAFDTVGRKCIDVPFIRGYYDNGSRFEFEGFVGIMIIVFIFIILHLLSFIKFPIQNGAGWILTFETCL